MDKMDFPGIELTVLEQWSAMMHEIFSSLVDAGFTSDEALFLVRDVANNSWEASRRGIDPDEE